MAPWFKHSVLWTISNGVLILRVDRTNFDVVTRQIEKVHRYGMFESWEPRTSINPRRLNRLWFHILIWPSWVRYRSESRFNRKSMSDFRETSTINFIEFRAPRWKKRENSFHLWKWLNIFPWLKLKILRLCTLDDIDYVSLGSTNFDVITRQTVKVHRDRILVGMDQELQE